METERLKKVQTNTKDLAVNSMANNMVRSKNLFEENINFLELIAAKIELFTGILREAEVDIDELRTWMYEGVAEFIEDKAFVNSESWTVVERLQEAMRLAASVNLEEIKEFNKTLPR